MTTVFISHSANEDEFAGDVLDGLKNLLETRRYKVLVDRSGLRVAREFEDQLELWMDSCDAAVVLLNEKALHSEWVRDEVTVLLHRRHMLRSRRRQGLFLLPVLIGGVRPGDVRSTGLRKLAKLQFLDGSAELDASVLAERIASLFACPHPGDINSKAMDEWIRRITYRIDQVGSESQLAEAARALEMSDDEISTVRLWGGSRFLAQRLMDSRLRRHTVEALGRLTPFMPTGDSRTLVHEIAPTWVDGQAAALLLPEAPDEGLVALLNAHQPETGEEYFARATCRAKTGYWSCVVGIAVGAQPVAELLTAWEKALEGDFVITTDTGYPGPREAPPYRCFLIIDPNGLNLEIIADAIRAMNERYPWLGILLLTGGSLPDDTTVRSWRLRNPVFLRPALKDLAEFTARQTVRDLASLTT
jgi:hypothetical protein